MNIAVLISGGVDSSVVLYQLVQQGYSVTAFYLKIWLEDELAFLGSCPWEEDLLYITAVCKKLGVQLEVISLQKEYWQRVVAFTLTEIQRGHTPNPDIMCNQQIKFGAFYELYAERFDAIATGHYAQTETIDGVTYLKRSPDAIKDQTYFLARLSQAQLKKALFPIGHMTKAEVRALAHHANLPTKERKDSQGICFLGRLKFSDFVKHHLGERRGELIEYETGCIKGMHAGFWFYTIGQRQGLGLAGGPWYVVSKDSQRNIVYISKEYYSLDKKRTNVFVEDLHWLSGTLAQTTWLVKLRHGPNMVQATLNNCTDGTSLLHLVQDDQGIAPGQYAVLYDADYCRASGVIQQNERRT